MSVARRLLPPTCSLPRLRPLANLSEEQVASALCHLKAVYCPIPPHALLREQGASGGDSGYASEVGDDADTAVLDTEALRADKFERGFAKRWLTGFVAGAEELGWCDVERRERLVQDACALLESLADEAGKVREAEDMGLMRDFFFATRLPISRRHASHVTVHVRLHDAPTQKGDDHTDVGLQSWGASVVLSELVCGDPARFHLAAAARPHACVVELGAGTGLLSLVLASLLPLLGSGRATVVATDYHPVVLQNLRANMTAHAARTGALAGLYACSLDWSDPDAGLREPSLRAAVPAHVLFAADVVYAPSHAVMLRDCAATLLAPDGTFWLMVSVRANGRFQGLTDTVEAAFSTEDCPRNVQGLVLAIVQVETVEKRPRIGRADECGYRLYKIAWS